MPYLHNPISTVAHPKQFEQDFCHLASSANQRSILLHQQIKDLVKSLSIIFMTISHYLNSAHFGSHSHYNHRLRSTVTPLLPHHRFTMALPLCHHSLFLLPSHSTNTLSLFPYVPTSSLEPSNTFEF